MEDTTKTTRGKKATAAVEPVAHIEDEYVTSEPETAAPAIAVASVAVQGSRFVVEWRTPAGRLRRALSDGLLTSATEAELNALEPFGDDFTGVVQDLAWSVEDVIEDLHNRGVWFLRDLTANQVQELYRGLIRRAISDTLRRVNEAKAQ